ncbi:MAG: hypothetical protein K2X37_07305 [Chitinophagaceae bacterium]|nr:hypothetical protein [Chitinophagaceae bacterium]
MVNEENIEALRSRYIAARNKYKPREIKALLVTEAPSCSLDKDFYFEDVPKQDSLFLEIMAVLYPQHKEQYLKQKRDPVLKEALLHKFKEDGFWLMDLAEVPVEVTGDSYEASFPNLLLRIEKAITKQTPIILIKANVFDICYTALITLGFNVINERLPFPGSGQQGVFREKFSKIIHS